LARSTRAVVYAIEKTAWQHRTIKMTADEHESALAPLGRLPTLSGLCFEQHVHTVKIELPRLAVEIQHTFHPHDVLALLLNQPIDSAMEAVRVKRVGGFNCAGCD